MKNRKATLVVCRPCPRGACKSLFPTTRLDKFPCPHRHRGLSPLTCYDYHLSSILYSRATILCSFSVHHDAL